MKNWRAKVRPVLKPQERKKNLKIPGKLNLFAIKPTIILKKNMEKLPSEILSIIFLYLDKKSRKSATATCQLWFDVIRNSNSSNHICYKRSFEELQNRIKNLEWDWKRWPTL